MSTLCECGQPAPIGNFVHGYSRTSEYQAYHMALQRCTNPENPQWKDYGGRGIEFRFLCFEQFIAEIGPKPSPKHSLDRKNNDGHYGPGNVRWATKKEQAANRRNPGKPE